MRTKDFFYELPAELIAQEPSPVRDASRLFVLDRASGQHTHTHFSALPQYLRPGDLLVLNNSRVIPARLRAVKPGSGGAVEILLVEEVQSNDWWVLLRPGKRVRPGSLLHLVDRAGVETAITAEVLEKSEEGRYRVRFEWADILQAAEELGEIPLPPYIERPDGPKPQDEQRYQTVYAGPAGSVAAPTAGLHFTPELLGELRRQGVQTAEVTLHVGLGTFAPVKAENLEEHRMHSERYEIPARTAQLIRDTKAAGNKVVAVGTTSLRVLEGATSSRGKTSIFIYPPYEFRTVDALLTNFHLPESTLLMLVSAFAAPGSTEGRELILQSYAEAVRERYRFFSYGDAMFIF